LYADIGILMAGGVTVPIYQSNLPHECEYIINDSGAKVVFVENPAQLAKVMAERDKLNSVVKVIYFEPTCTLEKPDAQGRTELKLDDVIKPGDKALLMSLGELRVEGEKWLGAHGGELEKRWAEIKAEDSFTFVYTSGTTGPPKGVVLTHK